MKTRKLTLEIEVPEDQVPANATGRLSHRDPKKGETFIGIDGNVWPCTGEGRIGIDNYRLVIETSEPWQVPEHLQNKRYNGWTIQQLSGNRIEVFCVTAGGSERHLLHDRHGIKEFAFAMRLEESDFEGMEPGKVYKLGEGQ